MNLKLPICIAIAWSYALFVFPLSASENTQTVQIIVDNSPALMQRAEAEIAQRQLFYRTWKLKRRRATRNTTIDIVSTVNAQTRWHGTPKALGRDGASALGATSIIANGCPNLLGALDQVRINLELQQPRKTHVIFFSSLIHAYPCADKTIALPQPVPDGLDLSFLNREGVRLTLLWVHPLQKSAWLTALQNAGLRNFQLLDPAATKALLQERGALYYD